MIRFPFYSSPEIALDVLILCHLFIGLVIGLVIFQYLGDRRAIILAAVGSILPDLVDKPLGHILLSNTIDFGRIYAHSGLFFISILVIGIVYHRKKGSWIVMALAVGILSHLLLDSMWEMPVTILYPFLGDFGHHYFPNYVGESFSREIRNSYEWVFGVSSLSMVLYHYRERLGRLREVTLRFVPVVVRNLALLLVVMGIVGICFGALSARNPFYGDTSPDQNLIVGLASSLGGLLAYRLWRVGAKVLDNGHSLDH
jgi:membrane-bound metal-dependent hydrolase YbcI (DUF457 family)